MYEKLVSYVSKQLEIEPSEITPDSTFESLGVDSLDIVEMIMDLESELGVELDMEEFYSLYSKEKIENAILYAKELKDRYTVLWVNYDFFGGNENVQ